jgi:hypothetical protein
MVTSPKDRQLASTKSWAAYESATRGFTEDPNRATVGGVPPNREIAHALKVCSGSKDEGLRCGVGLTSGARRAMSAGSRQDETAGQNGGFQQAATGVRRPG